MDRMKIVRFFMMSILFLSGGCSQPMRTLMDLDSEQRSQSSEIAGQRARFKVLLKDVKRNRVKVGMKRNAIIGRYGVPVLEEGNTILYRDPVNFLDSEKIYLTFDDNGILKETNLEEKDGQ